MNTMGFVLKDEEALHYVTPFDGDYTDVSSMMSEWGSVDVCYITGAPPYGKNQPFARFWNCLLKKMTEMRWSVAEMRLATWKIHAPDVKHLIRKVFRTQAKERQMMINSADIHLGNQISSPLRPRNSLKLKKPCQRLNLRVKGMTRHHVHSALQPPAASISYTVGLVSISVPSYQSIAIWANVVCPKNCPQG